MAKRRSGRREATALVERTPPGAGWGWVVFGWGVVAHGLFLLGDKLLRAPVSAFFFADGVHFLARAREIAEGTTPLGGALPFHPPVTIWLLVPLWRLFTDAADVYLASKLLMVAANAATYAVVYLLLRRRLPGALPIALLLPLGFGELLLSSVANSEAVYRLLLAVLLLQGRRWPFAAGLLHGAAALTRAEHLPAALALGLVAAALLPRWRRPVAWMALGAALVVAPYALAVRADLVAYNDAHAETLPEPLPTLVPVSFYGPLNFALAHTEEDVFFSRRGLPVTRGEAAALDPLDPTHNAYVVHGYRVGLAAIADDPGRFLARSWRKATHSLHAFAHGWTWRGLPEGDVYVRRPVDMAFARDALYETGVALLVLVGLWTLRRDRALLAVGLGLVAYRLAVNVAFFPYLRGTMIAAPFVVAVALHSLAAPFRRHGPRILLALWVALAVYHAAFAWRDRRVSLRGERDAAGTIIDDRTVVLTYLGLEPP